MCQEAKTINQLDDDTVASPSFVRHRNKERAILPDHKFHGMKQKSYTLHVLIKKKLDKLSGLAIWSTLWTTSNHAASCITTWNATTLWWSTGAAVEFRYYRFHEGSFYPLVVYRYIFKIEIYFYSLIWHVLIFNTNFFLISLLFFIIYGPTDLTVWLTGWLTYWWTKKTDWLSEYVNLANKFYGSEICLVKLR